MIGQTLLVKREPTNPKDKNAVAIYEEDSIVGHVPFTLPLSVFGKRSYQCLLLGLSLFIHIDIKWVWLPVCP